MVSDVYELTWFKVGMLIVLNSIRWYYSKQSWSYFKTIGMRESKTCTKYLTDFLMDFDRIWSAVWDLMVSWSSLSFCLSCLISIQGREPNLNEFVEAEKKLVLACSQIFTYWFSSQARYDDRHHQTVYCDTSLNDLDLQSVTFCWKNQKYLCLFSQIFSIDLEKVQYAAQNLLIWSRWTLLINYSSLF